ncbi:hypothetical protein QFC22_002264 [Naganishia vaughanmartiniae]|uniref:Uncharacterized protein n=1 Tax=Naganishia vaughanmartiniae TaxID=1424756 RepID=A0ACC2XC77_9TREE|nr:hypothetical protein QFC22_002264 [Naganishia vaughanmartiniae]
MASERVRNPASSAPNLPPAFVPSSASVQAPQQQQQKFNHALTIKAPTLSNPGLSAPPSQKNIAASGDTTQRLCRNVLIYGSCRFQDKGCVYAHTVGEDEEVGDGQESETAVENTNESTSSTPTAGFSFSTTSAAPVFKPGNKTFLPAAFTPAGGSTGNETGTAAAALSGSAGLGKAGFSTDSLAAPAFVPRNVSQTSPSIQHASAASTPATASHHGDLQTDSFFSPLASSATPAGPPPGSLASPSIAHKVDVSTPGLIDGNGMRGSAAAVLPNNAAAAAAPGITGPNAQSQTFVPYAAAGDPMSLSMRSHDASMRDVTGGAEKPLFPTDTRVLDHHLYTTPLPHTANLPQSHLPLHNFFLPLDLYTFLHDRTEAKLFSASADAALPAELHVYHSLHELVPDAAPAERSPRVFGHVSDVYRAKCRLDGRLYCLRRIEGFKLGKESAFSVLDKWRRIRHPNIVSVREAFTTRLFNDASVVFAYDYHPKSKTLFEEHLSSGPTPPGQPFAGISERILWSYVAQISNGLKAIHTAGLACRTVEPTKILLTGRNSTASNIAYHQQDDLLNFGKLLISLCCGSTAAVHALPPALDHIQANYSPDFKLIIMYLIGKPGPTKNIDDILVMMGPRILNEFDAMQNYADSLESGMEAELENGRVARLLIKLGFINERPEFQQDTRWSETGDRYVLKLFRDFVFHSVDETDASLDEKIMLVARDDQSCLIVSYKDIRKAIDMAYM